MEFSSIVDDPFIFNSNVGLVNVLGPLESPDFSPKIYDAYFILIHLKPLLNYFLNICLFDVHTNRQISSSR